MRKKIIGIVICLMLMNTFLTTAKNIENIPVINESDKIEPISNDQVEVPIWKLGDKSTYKLDRLNIDFKGKNISFYMDLNIDSFPLEVTKVTKEFYELTFNSSSNGFLWLVLDLKDGQTNISFDLKSPTIKGTILYNKTNMGIKEVHSKISGNFDIEIVDQPYIKLELFKMHKEINATIDLDIVMENPHLPIVKFPFGINECWGLPAENFTVAGTIKSPSLDNIDKINRNIINPILRCVDNIIGFPKVKRWLTISDVLLDVLPEINISYVLTEYLGKDKFKIPAVPMPIICCLSKDLVTVPAGTYECYNISLLGTRLGNIYYNTTLGVIVKSTGNFLDVFPSVSTFNAELISSTCNP